MNKKIKEGEDVIQEKEKLRNNQVLEETLKSENKMIMDQLQKAQEENQNLEWELTNSLGNDGRVI